jgi:hypothetical protein
MVLFFLRNDRQQRLLFYLPEVTIFSGTYTRNCHEENSVTANDKNKN